MASEILYEEVRMPDHHRILTSNNLLAGTGSAGDIGIYGTSTILEILERDGNSNLKRELEEKMTENIGEIRSLFLEILDQDDSIVENYFNNSLFDIRELCLFNSHIVLLPPTVSKDTFNTFYPFYEQLVNLSDKYKNRYDQVDIKDEESESKIDVISSFFSKKGPKKKNVYNRNCEEYIKGLKEYLRVVIDNDDYLINSYKYLYSFFNLKLELAKNIQKMAEENVVGKLCEKVILDIKKQYNTSYSFNEITKDGIKFKTIPAGFLLYRSYPSFDPPFPKRRPYVWAGFSFLDVVNYSTPKEEEVDNSSYDYCTKIGNVSTFRTKCNLNLIDLGDLQTVMVLREKMDEKTSESFSKGWVIDKNSNVVRKSEYEADAIVAQWLYDNGYDGYIGYGIPGIHDECCISQDRRLKDMEETIKGMGQKFPLEIRNIFPMQQLLPMCQEPFTKIDYKIILS